MWNLQKASNLFIRFIIVVLVFTAQLFDTTLALSDKRLCADENCKEIISLATGKINYRAGEKGMVSFRINADIRVKSKSAGKDRSLWGIEVNGREGYAPKSLIRETKLFISDKDLKYLVDVKPVNAVPILNTSEKLVEQEITEEATITKPLNVVPLESTEKPLENDTNVHLNTETPSAATPVLSEVVDGTEIPILTSELDGVVETVQEENESLSKYKMEEESDYDEDEEEEDDERNLKKEIKISESQQKSIEAEKIAVNNIGDEVNQQPQYKVEDIKIDEKNISESSQDLSDNSLKKNLFPKNQTENQIVSKQLKKETASENLQNLKISKTKIFAENEIESKSLDEQENKYYVTQEISSKNPQTVNKNQVEMQHTQENIKNSQELLKKNVEAENKPNNTTLLTLETPKQDSLEIQENRLNIIDNRENVNQIVENAENQAEIKQFNDKTKENSEFSNVRDNSTGNNILDVITPTETQLNDSVKNDNLSLKHVEISGSDNTNNQQELQTANIQNSLEIQNKLNIIDNRESVNQIVKNSEKDAEIKQFNDKTKDNSEIANVRDNSTGNIVDVITPTETQLNDSVKNDNLSQKHVEISGSDNTNNQQELQTANIQNSLEIENKLNIIDNRESVNPIVKNSENQFNDKTKHNDQDSSTGNKILDVITPTEPQLNDNVKNDNLSQENEEISVSDNTNNLPDLQAATPYNKVPAEQSLNNNVNVFQTDEIVTPTYNEYATTQPPAIDASSSTESPGIIETSSESAQYKKVSELHGKVTNQEQHVSQNLNPTPYSPYEVHLNTPASPSHYDITNQQQFPTTTNIPPNDYYAEKYDAVTTESSYQVVEESFNQRTTTVSYNSIPTKTLKDEPVKNEEQPKALPSSMPPSDENKENKGLFATIMGTVNNVLSINKKVKRREHDVNSELDRILFSNGNGQKIQTVNEEENLQYCNQIGPNGDCPQSEQEHDHLPHSGYAYNSFTKSIFNSDLTLDTFLKALASKILEISELLAFLVIVSASSLFFIFGYYCFCNSSREGALLFKLNQLESSLLASHKENAILKHNLISTRQKLASIEDNSFGSNDMVVSLKKELEEELMAKARLQEQITVLQKELENAADAGIELNKIVSELLSNQTGDESIISSVEDLQKQLNEQQNTILEINASLAEKSRENSELQLLIAEQNARYESELANLQRDNDELEHEKGNILTKLDEIKNDFDKDITAALEGKNLEIKRLQNEIVDLKNEVENEHTKWQTSVAKIEALEECLKNVRRDPNVNITEVIDVANVKAQLIEAQKKCKSLKERLEIELDQRKLSENQLEILSAEVEKLKQDFNQSEKDKLEAQTRLEVLSNYFKDKENQLQKELSLKEAMWLKQQGETTTTVDRVTAMQEEIQSLKSQNDSLRAEIEAQVAAHKAQTGTLENRAHETWLAARQSDRRYEEARVEATALRRQLTALAGGNVNEANKPPAGPAGLGDELTQAPSPIHMESPGSPMLGRMPPPPFLPPPFMGPPPPFMGMPPPPPFVPPGEMRPAPLGRIMSPPPQRSGRFSPQHLDYEDYLDYEGNNTWHRHTYSPPRTYRSLSPTDSRYNYGTERDLMSTYDTETDFSPPPSPRESRRRGGLSSERIDNNNKSPYGNTKRNKGPLSSGSEKSFNTPHHHDTKTKKGKEGGGGGGKNLV